jgi:hypothetical protein
MESLTFFGVSMEYFGVFKWLLGLFVLISFRSDTGILSNVRIPPLCWLLGTSVRTIAYFSFHFTQMNLCWLVLATLDVCL